MPPNRYTNVRVMSIQTIAGLWYSESIGVPLFEIENELRRSVLNMADNRDWRSEGLLPLTDLSSLPDVNAEISRDHLREFCHKQSTWPLPRFWFPEEAPLVRSKGRPSDMGAIVQELERRAGAGELERTVTAEARALREWIISQDLAPIQVNSIRKKISTRYYDLIDQCG